MLVGRSQREGKCGWERWWERVCRGNCVLERDGERRRKKRERKRGGNDQGRCGRSGEQPNTIRPSPSFAPCPTGLELSAPFERNQTLLAHSHTPRIFLRHSSLPWLPLMETFVPSPSLTHALSCIISSLCVSTLVALHTAHASSWASCCRSHPTLFPPDGAGKCPQIHDQGRAQWACRCSAAVLQHPPAAEKKKQRDCAGRQNLRGTDVTCSSWKKIRRSAIETKQEPRHATTASG